MRDIEKKISPLLASMFPSFYASEGPNFIAFIIAYYEWLENNFQLLDLEDLTNFNVGDTVQQDNVTGTIYAVDSKSILVLVDGIETFKCFNVCSELIPVTSSSGGSTYILRGGTTRRLGSLFMSRNLGNFRDIDKTLDLFIVRFKEKYLKNIEFDTQTNKRLLVKNSLDLFRSKGTERSIDLFFRLIYGVKADTYYPGDDLFRLSDADWFKPRYIEINSTSVDRAITLVGKTITGVTSGATAFVERYVKKKVNEGYVHVFLVSNVRGTFEVNELLKNNQIYNDSPRVIGSFTDAVVLDGSENFNVGDIINFESQLGLGGIGRVISTEKGTGEVSFKIDNTGWGYTVNKLGSAFSYSANTFLADKYMVLANVQPGQFISDVNVTAAGLGYNNTDIITISSFYNDALARPVTNSTGGIMSCVVTNRGSGFNSAKVPSVAVTNSTGYATSGSSAAFSLDYDYPKKYFEYLDRVFQKLYTVGYSGASNEGSFEAGQLLSIGGTANGILTAINTANDTMIISMLNNSSLAPGSVISVFANISISATAATVSNSTVHGEVIFVANTGTIELGIQRGTFAVGDVLYQRDTKTDEYAATATITRTSDLSIAGGFINVADMTGVFRPGANVFIIDKPTETTYAELKTISLAIAVANTTNGASFSDVNTPTMYSSLHGTSGFVSSLSSGQSAQYRIGTITDPDFVYVNTDRLSNTALLNTRLNALAYGFPANSAANSQSILYGTLSHVLMTIGSVDSLDNINPGTGYNRDPVTSVHQPYLTSYQAYDYIFDIDNTSGSFVIDELISQDRYENRVRIFVDSVAPYKLGELIYAANSTSGPIANGIITTFFNSVNAIEVKSVTGTFPASNTYNIKSLISTANSYIVNAVPFTAQYTAKGRVKSFTNDKIYVKRIQLDNNFEVGNTFFGSLTGSQARIVSINPDTSSDLAGLNAKIDTNASTANGVISGIQVIDSGYGFSNDDSLVFTVESDERTGTVQVIRGGVGTGTGYYRTAKGFASDISKIHDGDYYQEYSYDIISRIPLDKYAAMFKKVMHTAGTRFFGNVLIDTVIDTTISVAPALGTTQDIGNTSPYNIQDRSNIDIEDRDRIYIEIRE